MLLKGVSKTQPLSSVIPEFDDVMTGYINIKIDPDIFIPLTRVRALAESGVSRLVKLLQGQSESDNGYNFLGIALGSDMPIIVELTGWLRKYLHLYVHSLGILKANAKIRIEARE